MTDIITYEICATGSGGNGSREETDTDKDVVRDIPSVETNLFPERIIETASPGSDRDVTLFRSLDFFLSSSLLTFTATGDTVRYPIQANTLSISDNFTSGQPETNLDNVRYLTGLLYHPNTETNVTSVGNSENSVNMRMTPGNDYSSPRLMKLAENNYDYFYCPFVVLEESSRLQGRKIISTMNYVFMHQLYKDEPFLEHFPQEEKQEAFALNYTFGKNVPNSLSSRFPKPKPDSANKYLHALIQPGQKYLDVTFEAPQPFYEDEMDHIQTGNPITADVKVVITSDYSQDGSSVQGFSDTTDDEKRKKSVYRLYKEEQLTTRQVCEDKVGSVVKFTSNNVDEFSDISDEFKSQFSKRVEINISAPTGRNNFVSDLLNEYDMDKYIMQMMSDTDGLYQGQDAISDVAKKDLFVDQFYDSDSFSINSDEYYLQYAQPGESATDVKARVDALLPNYNDSRFLENIESSVWTKYEDSLGLIKFTIPSDATFETIQGATIPLRNVFGDTPGLFGTGSIVNELEYPLGFRDGAPSLWQLDEIKYAICAAKLKTMLEPKGVRSYADILSGEKCFSEIIGYKVNKHEVINGIVEKEPVQQFYLMGHGRNNEINFCDSQVIFEKSYQYEIFSINFVVGSIYEHRSVSRTNVEALSDKTIIRNEVASQQSWSIIEAPFFKKRVSIVDRPPIAPQVTFLPFQGIEDRLRIMLQSNFGSVKQKPIKILEQDNELIKKMRAAQPSNVTTGEIEYSNDSLPESFQAIRLETPPESYSDFSNSTHVREYPTIGRTIIIEEDIFEANKNYYYIFRALDKRGISNPTEVYRFRLVSYANGIFMDVEQYDFKEPEIGEICFRELIQIEPNLKQRSIDFSNIDSVGTPEFFNQAPPIRDIKLGNEKTDPVWGRKFKMRITSKSSGRAMDVIFKFKQDKDTIDPTFGFPGVDENEGPCD